MDLITKTTPEPNSYHVNNDINKTAVRKLNSYSKSFDSRAGTIDLSQRSSTSKTTIQSLFMGFPFKFGKSSIIDDQH